MPEKPVFALKRSFSPWSSVFVRTNTATRKKKKKTIPPASIFSHVLYLSSSSIVSPDYESTNTHTLTQREREKRKRDGVVPVRRLRRFDKKASAEKTLQQLFGEPIELRGLRARV